MCATSAAVMAGVLTPATAVGAPSAPAAPPAGARAAAGPAGTDADRLVRELGERSGADVRLARSASTGRATFVGARPGHPVLRPADVPFGAGVAADATARGYLRHYGRLFGVRDEARELATTSVTPVAKGSIVKYAQQVDGIRVLGGELVVSVDPAGNLLSVNGETSPATPGSRPLVSAAEAEATAKAVVARATRTSARALTASAPELNVADPAVVAGLPVLRPSLVWSLEVRGPEIRRNVLVDAAKGSVVLNLDLNAEALSRNICDGADKPRSSDACSSANDVRAEGGAVSAVGDVNAAYDYSGDVYRFLSTVLGRDSLDGKGMALKSMVRFCPSTVDCPYDNAYWNGFQMTYGRDFAKADDVVGHELAHGLTEHTSHLYYFYQSGAINESMSDVFGELIDQWNARDYYGRDSASLNWQLGEDLPGGAIRSMSSPTSSDQPDRMRSGLYWDGLGQYGEIVDNGGVHYNSGVGNKAAYLIVNGGASPRAPAVRVPAISGATATERIVKAAKIYYRVQQMLTSSSDYADLYSVLPQACDALVGTAGIVRTDCDATVRAAVTATEMDLQPVQPLTTIPAEAAVCPTGTAPSNVFYDDIENATTTSANFSKGKEAGTSGEFWVPQDTHPRYDVTYAKSGTHNIWGDNAGGSESPVYQNSWVQTRSITLPTGTPYLRFDHGFAFEFDENGAYDGGVVEYSTNGGTSWLDAGAMIDSGAAYNSTIEYDPAQSLSGEQAFGRTSSGYTATRVNLAALAGTPVRFRWRVATDGFLGSFGWYIDDVRVYSCPAAAKPGAPTIGTASASDAAATVTWFAPTPNGGAPVTGYTVTATNGTTTKSERVNGAATSGTVGNLTNGLPWTLTVAAESSAGRGPASAASAAVTPRWAATIALTASPTTAVYPARTSLRMTVVRKGTTTPVPGATVQLFAQKASSPAGTPWSYTGVVTTDAAGSVTTPRDQTVSTVYFARLYESTAVAGPSVNTGAVRVSVAHAVFMAASSTAIKLGQTVTLTGSVYPQQAGKVVLQKLSGTSWVNLTGERATSSTGTYSIGYKPTARVAVRTVRVVSVATPDNVSGTSATRSFSVS